MCTYSIEIVHVHVRVLTKAEETLVQLYLAGAGALGLGIHGDYQRESARGVGMQGMHAFELGSA